LAAILSRRHTTGEIVVRGFRHAGIKSLSTISNIAAPCQGKTWVVSRTFDIQGLNSDQA